MRNAKGLAMLAMRRLQARRWLDAAGPSALVATAAAAVAIVVARAFGWSGSWAAVGCFVATLAACMRALLALRASPSMTGAAAEIDERLRLDGRVSAAIALAGRGDAFAQAAVADGERIASEAGRASQVRRSFPVGVPSSLAWWPVALGALALLVWMIPLRAPRVDASAGLAAEARDAAALAERADGAESRVTNAVKALDESPEAKERLADLLAEVARPPAAQPASTEGGRQAEPDARREAEALQRAASIEERLGRELEMPEMLALTQVNDAMARLPEQKGVGAELSQALKSGDLQKAMAEMQKLAAQAAGGDPKAAAEAKQALEQLANAMEKSAQQGASAAQQQALEQSLKQAGLDPKLAKDPVAAQAAAQKAAQQGQCSQAQAQQVSKQAQAQQQAKQQQQQMAKSTRECSNGSCTSAKSQLSRQQSQRRMQAALQTAMRECRNPSALGWSMPWQRPPPNQSGSSGGDKGGKGGAKGKPGQNGDPKTDGQTKALADAKVGERQESAGDGNPLDQAAARDFVRAQGMPVGTSQQQVRAVAAKVAEGLEEGSEEDPVPARLKAAHKRYFEEWKRRVDQGTPPAPSKPAAP